MSGPHLASVLLEIFPGRAVKQTIVHRAMQLASYELQAGPCLNEKQMTPPFAYCST